MSRLLVTILLAATLAACAQGGGSGSGSISAYGTLDEGVSVKK